MNTKGKEKILRAYNLTEQRFNKLRQFSLSLTWTIGQQFNIKSAGEPKNIADDVKERVSQ